MTYKPPGIKHYIYFYEPGHTRDGSKNVTMSSFGPIDNAPPLAIGNIISGLVEHPGTFQIISIEHFMEYEGGVVNHEMHCYTMDIDVEHDVAEKLRNAPRQPGD